MSKVINIIDWVIDNIVEPLLVILCLLAMLVGVLMALAGIKMALSIIFGV